ncbi:hypothetical protein KSP39_PZI000961 [Platanthera zijinensis]|uniref:Uncharacterized protein n=1 Tax=Platanthera zijinensis TaxID=2320716 RepID=A0AAP0C0Q6_9ASPA
MYVMNLNMCNILLLIFLSLILFLLMLFTMMFGGHLLLFLSLIFDGLSHLLIVFRVLRGFIC